MALHYVFNTPDDKVRNGAQWDVELMLVLVGTFGYQLHPHCNRPVGTVETRQRSQVAHGVSAKNGR